MHNKLIMFIILCLVISAFTASVYAAEKPEFKYSLWLGGYSNSYTDYEKKITEFGSPGDDVLPAASFDMTGIGENFRLNFNSHYEDENNFFANLMGRHTDRFSGKIKFMSYRRQLGTDLLENINAREESASGTPGGKMMSHEDLNPGLDYNFDRTQIETDINALISRKGNIKLTASHRFWSDNGHEQKVASMHCFSCHLESKAVPIERTLNQFTLGLEGKPGPIGVGYNFYYSKFKSDASPANALYDEAKHPVNGGSGAEFSSRLIYSGEEVDYALYPETQKIGNKVRFFTRNPRHQFSGSASYSQVKNSVTDLEYKTYGAVLNFNTFISNTMRLIARTSYSSTDADNVYVEVPLWRYDYEGDSARTGGGQDFSFTRYSTLNRVKGSGSVEMIYKPNRKTTLSILGGYDGVSRKDFEEVGTDENSNTLIGQAKIKYREGLKYTLSARYRLEKTDRPLTYTRGLFESSGRDLQPLDGNSSVFYFQREDLKYQDITSLPTIKHQFDINGTARLSPKVNFHAKLKVLLDKNNELDSIDVEHSSFQPGFGLNLNLNPRWVISSGYNYNYMKSVGPVAVVMMDG